MHYASTALTALNKSQKDSLEKIQNYCVHYTRRAVDTGKPVFLMINFVSVGQHIARKLVVKSF